MILTDKDIKQRISDGELIIENVCLNNLNSISYDLTTDIIYLDNNGKYVDKYILRHGEVVFVKTQEKISIPSDIMGSVEERNSLMRLGLSVTAPKYQPGHTTYAFLRVINLSHKNIELKKGMGIAQISFYKLTSPPFHIYGENENGTFQFEDNFIGLGDYSDSYNDYIKAAEEAKEDLVTLESKVYSNILTFMGIFVSLFSFVIFNFNILAVGEFKVDKILIINLSLCSILTTLLGLIFIIINHKNIKYIKQVIIAFIVVLIILNIFAFYKYF